MELGQCLLGGTGDESVAIQTAGQYTGWLERTGTFKITTAVFTHRASRISRRAKRVSYSDTASACNNIHFQHLAWTIGRCKWCVHGVRHHEVGLQTGWLPYLVKSMCAGSARKHGETQPVGQAREWFRYFHRVQLLTIGF